MPTNVAPLITGTSYVDDIPVPSTGEIATQAALTDTAVALGNRIEFVKQAVIGLATEVPSFVELTDEFISFGVDTSENLLMASHTWHWVGTSEPGYGAVDAKNPGGVKLTGLSGTESIAIFLGIDEFSEAFWADNIARFSVVIEPSDSFDSSSSTFRIGFAKQADSVLASITEGLGFIFEPDDSLNWQIWAKTVAGGEKKIDTGISVELNKTYVLEGIQDDSGNWTFKVNSVVIDSYQAGIDPIPSGIGINFGVRAQRKSGGGGPAQVTVRRLSVITKPVSPRYTP